MNESSNTADRSAASRGSEETSSGGASKWLKRGVIVLAIGLVILGMRQLPTAEWIEAIRGEVDALGAFGPVAYGIGYVIAALAFVPGAAITIGAGTIFGLGIGTVIVSIASTTAAALAFPLARTLLRSRIEKLAAERKSFQAVDEAIEEGGWKIVGLLRLSPVVPFSALNYLLGLTSVAYVPAVLVSWVAMLPGTLLYVSIGAAGGEVAAGNEKSALEWTLLGAGLLATIVVTALLTKMARKRMREHDVPLEESETRNGEQE